MRQLHEYLLADGLYDDAAIVQETIAEFGVDRSIARNTERTPVRDLLLAAREHNVELLARRKIEEVAAVRALLAKDALTHEDWRWLSDRGYALFSADEASADGALWNTSYRLTTKATDLG